MSNPFFDNLDNTLRGKLVEVRASNGDQYTGTLSRIDHKRGSVLLYDADRHTDGGADEADIASTFIRNVESIAALERLGVTKQIDFPRVESIDDSPYLPDTHNNTPPDTHLRGAYRDGFTGSFPVCREIEQTYELINGHKRIEACRRVGLERHPVEVISCTDEQAKELVELAHN